MEIKWMEEITGHLARIAKAHEHVAAAFDRMVKCAEGVAAVTMLRYYGTTRRCLEIEEPLRAKLDKLALELAESNEKP